MAADAKLASRAPSVRIRVPGVTRSTPGRQGALTVRLGAWHTWRRIDTFARPRAPVQRDPARRTTASSTTRSDNSELGAIVNDLAERYPKVQVAATLDALKAAGFHWATRSGVTIAIDDVVTPPRKAEILDRYEKDAEKIEKQYQRGVITDDERRQELIEIWTKATSEVAKEMEANFPKDEPGLDDGQLRRPRKHDADPPDRRHAWSGGQPQGRDHPAADQVQLP